MLLGKSRWSCRGGRSVCWQLVQLLQLSPDCLDVLVDVLQASLPLQAWIPLPSLPRFSSVSLNTSTPMQEITTLMLSFFDVNLPGLCPENFSISAAGKFPCLGLQSVMGFLGRYNLEIGLQMDHFGRIFQHNFGALNFVSFFGHQICKEGLRLKRMLNTLFCTWPSASLAEGTCLT